MLIWLLTMDMYCKKYLSYNKGIQKSLIQTAKRVTRLELLAAR